MIQIFLWYKKLLMKHQITLPWGYATVLQWLAACYRLLELLYKFAH